MQIKITPRTLGGTEFTAQPARLHLGAQNAEGVDRLVFQLPAEWAGCSVTLHIRHSDGTLLSVNGKGGAVVLDAQDVGALPAPVAPQAGALLRVLSIRSDGSLVVDTVTPAALKTLLEAT